VLDLLANLQRFEDQMSMLKRRVQQHAAAKLSTQQSHTAPAGAGTPGSSSTVQHTALQLQQVEPYQHESYPFNKTASPGQLTVPGSSSAAAAASPDRISKRLQVTFLRLTSSECSFDTLGVACSSR
jgi:hypothetical protein